MQAKQCGKCGVIRSIDDFYRDKTRKDGREWICKECKKAYKRELRKKKRRSQTTERAEITLEQLEAEPIPNFPEEFKCSFCGEIKKEEEMVWYDENAPLSDDALNICKECYEKRE